MHLYHPVMFVGLGGTGCRIGAELERRLREELCGPDGLKLHGPDFSLTELQPFQLPSCLQFVYADLSEDELAQVRQRSVPNEAHMDVAARTAYYAYDLLPEFESYPKVAKNLRVKVPDAVGSWLPPGEHEPMVVPLRLGAGQLPTVGRAALFETVSDSVEVVRQPISRAIDAITTSAIELRVLNPTHNPGLNTVDVFVAFSVAGGTGAGIFYDYLHLVESAFQRVPNLQVKIYPLILMPSAFETGRGGGIPAALNAGRALLDMFRLIDDLNQDQRAHGDIGADLVSQGLHVRYPREGDIKMRLGSMQTAFLFSKAAGIERDDLHRSVVALIMSLVGQETPAGTDAAGAPMSFADSFINSAIDRQSLSPTRIGCRGVSTSLVGSLTVPFDDLADMFAGRLLGRGVRELLVVPPGRAESNRGPIRDFFKGAHVAKVWERGGVEFDDPAAGAGAKGAAMIRGMVKERVRRMNESLQALDQTVTHTMPEIVRDFAPMEGARMVLHSADVFRLKRVVFGDQALSEDIDRLGVRGVMESRRVPPTPPVKQWETDPRPPQLLDIKDGLIRRAKASEAAVGDLIKQQDEWFRYKTRRVWHAAWNDHRNVWQQRLNRFCQHLRSLVDELAAHERECEEAFNRRAEDLYRTRIGVSYLLPLRNDLEQTYAEMLRRLAKGGKRENATEGEIVSTLLGESGWEEALAAAAQPGRGAEYGVRLILARLKQEVVRILRGGDQDDVPLLPHMRHLLRVAAKHVHDVPVAESDVQQFVATLAGMLPAGFVPEGSGKLSVLVVYPAAAADDEIERWLGDQLRLSTRRGDLPIQFRVGETEAITVARVRSGMGITEVPELRQVLLDWAGAVQSPRSDSFLPWRQRLGFKEDWLATTEAHRQQILQRLLCAAWNGQVTCADGTESPSRIRISLPGGPDAEAMRLDLTTFGKASSWGSLLQQYEMWTLTDGGEIRLNFCASLMETVPLGFAETIADPDPLYWELAGMAERQVKILREMRERMPAGSRQRCDQLLAFWEVTFPAARRRTFLGAAPNGNSLEALEVTVKNREQDR
ncbi:tubulin-like doman-containing protein [Actinoplanes subtropicus]|uniref:tubulin-like doman-containing protein n=1 Tax=Actinoplanes subtropicus TaxID=543632 RepID=UPI00068FA085|nr:tubulin-like doman-containing protein [Actinoplanes subtropicus]